MGSSSTFQRDGVLCTNIADIPIALGFSISTRVQFLIQTYQMGNPGMLLQDLYCKKGVGLLV